MNCVLSSVCVQFSEGIPECCVHQSCSGPAFVSLYVLCVCVCVCVCVHACVNRGATDIRRLLSAASAGTTPYVQGPVR